VKRERLENDIKGNIDLVMEYEGRIEEI